MTNKITELQNVDTIQKQKIEIVTQLKTIKGEFNTLLDNLEEDIKKYGLDNNANN